MKSHIKLILNSLRLTKKKKHFNSRSLVIVCGITITVDVGYFLISYDNYKWNSRVGNYYIIYGLTRAKTSKND